MKNPAEKYADDLRPAHEFPSEVDLLRALLADLTVAYAEVATREPLAVTRHLPLIKAEGYFTKLDVDDVNSVGKPLNVGNG